MQKFLKEEFIKFWLGLLSTAVGVLIALTINSNVDNNKEETTYKSMLKAINIEAVENKQILKESFWPNYKSGIVRREFSTSICDEFMSTQIFLERASPKTIGLLTNYSLNLKRANNFRVADEKYKYNQKLYKKWGKNLTIAFTKVLGNCDELINVVTVKTR